MQTGEQFGIGRITAWVVGSGLALVGLSIIQITQNFSQSIPAVMGLGMLQAAIILGFVYWFQVMLTLLAAAEQQIGYIGGAIFGGGWLLLSLIDFPEHPISQALAVGMMLTALILVISSFLALRTLQAPKQEQIATV